MKTKLRIIYAITFFAVLLIEICIALFIRDDFIRPYIGDVLVTVLICALLRIFIPEGVKRLGESAFFTGPKCKKMVIPASVTEISPWVFADSSYDNPQNHIHKDLYQ